LACGYLDFFFSFSKQGIEVQASASGDAPKPFVCTILEYTSSVYVAYLWLVDMWGDN
jgi:hypothetical protein